MPNLEKQLHRECRCPGWEYRTVKGPLMAGDHRVLYPPHDQGWELNRDMPTGAWKRFPAHEESYWKRKLR